MFACCCKAKPQALLLQAYIPEESFPRTTGDSMEGANSKPLLGQELRWVFHLGIQAPGAAVLSL